MAGGIPLSLPAITLYPKDQYRCLISPAMMAKPTAATIHQPTSKTVSQRREGTLSPQPCWMTLKIKHTNNNKSVVFIIPYDTITTSKQHAFTGETAWLNYVYLEVQILVLVKRAF
ncbi:MAG: hypothetical protein CL840_03225 [Crocinitomicaceae bacterium]|nr:hypothetical protein [Crocinitomicaceae bacterium]